MHASTRLPLCRLSPHPTPTIRRWVTAKKRLALKPHAHAAIRRRISSHCNHAEEMSSQQEGRSKQRDSPHFQSGRANSRADDEEEEEDQHNLYDPHSLRIWPAYDTKHLEVLEYPIKELGECGMSTEHNERAYELTLTFRTCNNQTQPFTLANPRLQAPPHPPSGSPARSWGRTSSPQPSTSLCRHLRHNHDDGMLFRARARSKMMQSQSRSRSRNRWLLSWARAWGFSPSSSLTQGGKSKPQTCLMSLGAFSLKISGRTRRQVGRWKSSS